MNINACLIQNHFPLRGGATINGFEISEKKLEDIIYSHLIGECENASLLEFFEEETNKDCHIVKRQLQIGGYGIADIVVFNIDPVGGGCSVTIMELKKGVIDTSAVVQAMRYKAGLKHFFEGIKKVYVLDISVVLIGGGIHENDGTIYLPSSIEDLSIVTYDITGAGIEFKDRSSWSNNSSFGRDLKRVATCIDYTCFDMFCAHDNHFFRKGEEGPGRMVI